MSGRLSEIKLSSIMIVGQGDKLTPPKYSEFLAKGIPGSTVRVIQDAGHMVALEQPKAFNQAIAEFMATI